MILGAFEQAARDVGKSGRSRARLLDAPADVMNRTRPDVVTVHDLAAAADMTTRTFCRYFKGKDEIAAAPGFKIGARITPFIDGHRQGFDDAVERLNLGTREASFAAVGIVLGIVPACGTSPT